MEVLEVLYTILLIILSLFSTVDSTVEDVVNYDLDPILNEEENITIEAKEIQYNLVENLDKDIELIFCPKDDCVNMFVDSFELSQSEIKCAFYEFDDEKLSEVLLEKSHSVDVELIIDDRYLEEEPLMKLYNTSIKIFSDVDRGTRYNNYMHDKFCVIDDRILITGSANPTARGLYQNNNNIMKIESKYFVKNFENEFDQMKGGFWGTNKKSQLEYNNLTLVYENNSYIMSSYFCPQDDCIEPILHYIENAQEEIVFAAFALTHDDIRDALIMKQNQGVKVLGVIESRNQNLKGSDYTELSKHFQFALDTNKATMHHKFFVIDNQTVITGSMNPTASGVKYNDENYFVIENDLIATSFRDEFYSLIE